MAVDKLVDSTQLNADLTSVANAIRTKGGTSAQMAFPAGFVSAVENIPGGASKGFLLLDTIIVPEDVRAVSVDLSDYQELDFFFVVENLTLSASDWIYLVRNGTSPSGGVYADSAVQHKGICFMQVKNLPSKPSAMVSAILAGATYNQNNDTRVTNLYAYTYVESKRILAGSKFYICGGNYADL